MKTNRKWSDYEDSVVMRYVQNNSQKLSKCFSMVSEHLTDEGNPRTPTAVQAHWYSVLAKKHEALCLMSTTASIEKPSTKEKERISLWKKLLSFINKIVK